MPNTGATPTPFLEQRPEPSLTEADPKMIAGRYVIMDRLGEGGMGKVYQALDPVLQRHVAIKVLPFSNFSDEHFRRFQQEARAISKLSHPGIVRALDFGVTDRREPFLIMEYVKGESLDAVLEAKGRLELNEFKSIFGQITRAMIHAHSAGVVHRDLKPSNIMIYSSEEEQKAFVFDFGIAKILEDSGSIVNTRTGVVIGSPRYISPEQVYGGSLDGRSDVYSLGCVMFEALTGSPPFKGANAMETIQMHLNEEPPRLSERIEGVSDELEQLIARTLAKTPDQRYQSTGELLKALETLEHEPGTANNVEVVGVAPVEGHSSQSIPGLLFFVFGALVVIVAFGLWVVPTSLGVNYSDRSSERVPFSKDEKATLANEKTLVGGDEIGRVVTEAKPIEKESLEALRKTNNFDQRQKILNLHGTPVTDSDLKNLSNFPRLEHLSLNRTNVTIEGVRHIVSKLHGLKSLHLKGVKLNNQDLAEIAKIKSLTSLAVSFNENLNDEGIKNLAELPDLESLDLRSTGFTAEGLKYFCQKPNLTIVVDSYCQGFSNANLKVLAKTAGIKDVTILSSSVPLQEIFSVPDHRMMRNVETGELTRKVQAVLGHAEGAVSKNKPKESRSDKTEGKKKSDARGPFDILDSLMEGKPIEKESLQALRKTNIVDQSRSGLNLHGTSVSECLMRT